MNRISQHKILNTKMPPNKQNLFIIKLSNCYSKFTLCLIFIHYVKLYRGKIAYCTFNTRTSPPDLGKGIVTLKSTRRGKIITLKHLKGLSIHCKLYIFSKDNPYYVHNTTCLIKLFINKTCFKHKQNFYFI